MSKQIYVTTTQYLLEHKQKIYNGTQNRHVKEHLCTNVLTPGGAYKRYNGYWIKYSHV